MSLLWLLACVPGAVIWVVVLVLPWRPWSTRERLEPSDLEAPPGTDDLTVLIPARNEAEVIGRTLGALKRQTPELAVIVVDDHSTDGTANLARAVGLPNLRVVSAEALAEGWTGKLWALDQGLAEVETDLTLLLDADIELAPGMIRSLQEQHRKTGGGLVSVMATLETGGVWEKLLMPAYVYFFKLLYPFRLSNSAFRWVAAGAGGCMLVDTAILGRVGAFASMRSEIIDDCALAARIKADGNRTWIGLARGVRSRRMYGGLGGIWSMVARTAFTQLRYSTALLAVCVVLLTLAFVLPVAGIAAADPPARTASAIALAAMAVSYLPTLRFYRLSPLWALLLPVTGAMYLLMTIDSAWRYARGVRSAWRGRTYTTGPPRK
jgi:hopene-associated glycosyltransferase HpnB